MSEIPTVSPAQRPVLTGPAERRRVLDLLRGMEPVLRSRGVRRLRLFGSVARGEADLASDVDLIAEIDSASAPTFSLIDLIGLEQQLTETLGRPVQMTTATEKMRSYVRDNVEREAAEIF
jgi:hypothetical protein